MNSVPSADLCDKAFLKHQAFSAGIYSIGSYFSFKVKTLYIYFFLGCACDTNTTLGFEVMLDKEGPKNLFRLLHVEILIWII